MDVEIKSMLRQAVGLAKYMDRPHVVDGLRAVMQGDKEALRLVSDDSMTRYVDQSYSIPLFDKYVYSYQGHPEKDSDHEENICQ